MSRSYRLLEPADREALATFLRGSVPENVFVLHCLEESGVRGFAGAFDGPRLVGAAVQNRGMYCAAAQTRAEDAAGMVDALRRVRPWSGVIGPEAPCSAIVRRLDPQRRARIDRLQRYMAVSDPAALGPIEPVRLATSRDEDELVRFVMAYRVEDRLAADGDDNRTWIRDHVAERTRAERMYVAERGGKIVYCGAFTFIGPEGSGLGGIYTTPAERGRGLGSRATASLCALGFEHGPWVTLHVAADNPAAIRCYEKAGLHDAGAFRLTFR